MYVTVLFAYCGASIVRRALLVVCCLPLFGCCWLLVNSFCSCRGALFVVCCLLLDVLSVVRWLLLLVVRCSRFDVGCVFVCVVCCVLDVVCCLFVCLLLFPVCTRLLIVV